MSERGDTFAAVVELHERGMKPVAIAAELGLTDKTVYYHLNRLKKRSARRDTADADVVDAEDEVAPQPTWTPSKIERARRIVDRSMYVIADALDVPLLELLRLVRNDLNAAEDEREADEAQLARMEEISDADVPEADDLSETEPDREEALAPGASAAGPAPALGAADGPVSIAPPATSVEQDSEPPVTTAPGALFRLHNEVGEYLHEHGRGMTRISRFMWRGSAEDIRHLKRRKPHLRDLIEEACLVS